MELQIIYIFAQNLFFHTLILFFNYLLSAALNSIVLKNYIIALREGELYHRWIILE